ncbi:hypothetical protein MJ257_21355 [Paenibacillus timonensis]|uniref:ABC transporter permease n=1 Tax=Paenibacillus timonensis TaxID=225915 RepID=A0ABW3S938_9BACL|nr:hypothetical protein [Paenibacillus timonensis]MCH1642651.1 hypothetical protein [Paenibacillus timonensis]
MLRLLKYDLKRNGNTFLIVGAILVITEAFFSIYGNSRGWVQASIIALCVMLYLFVAMLLVIFSLRTFQNNLRAYSRRLLPVRTIWSVLSPWMLGLIGILLLGIVAIIHGFIYNAFVGFGLYDHLLFYGNGIQSFEQLVLSFPDLASIAMQLLLIYTFLYALVALSITIGAMIRGKLGTWVGLLSFLVIQYGSGWLASKLFGVGAGQGVPFVVIESSSKRAIEASVSSGVSIAWGPALFEIAFVGLMLFAIVYLMNRKVEI